ncbi:hypothetical protein PtA15_7A445 [Puccinia triticina]|uniref:Thiolase C-terminal domain-containing protein n=1 Tax=Puccinia triticina TaxID=208348 RepID=A0ABY7CRX8_9BASI|nr:uncharacterized protein PtA15_7A445 [Puccinia triticina]WAQ86717.1 hypothetical protein PtA15_7A445 [Puccinia triticina]
MASPQQHMFQTGVSLEPSELNLFLLNLNFAIESYQRAAKAWEAGAFKDKIVLVEINFKLLDKVTIVSKDEDHINIKFDKVRKLKPVFKNERGTVTAANAFTLNDGASAVVLMTAEESRLRGIKKLAKIISPAYAEAASFPVVALASMKILGIKADKVNVNGGAVALGHPIGSSCCWIVVSLIHSLKPGKYGVAGVCNGGGAASAMVIQRL